MILHPSCTCIAASKPQAWGSGLHKEHKIMLTGSGNVLKLSNIHYYPIYITHILPKWNAFLIKLFSLNGAYRLWLSCKLLRKCVYAIGLSLGALLTFVFYCVLTEPMRTIVSVLKGKQSIRIKSIFIRGHVIICFTKHHTQTENARKHSVEYHNCNDCKCLPAMFFVESQPDGV